MCSLTNLPQNDFQHLGDLWIIQSIVDKLTIFAVRNYPSLPQHP
jgi:hypothetical protein